MNKNQDNLWEEIVQQEVVQKIKKAYVHAVEKHPKYAPKVINEGADIGWVRVNLNRARERLKEELSADHVVNCEWLESLEAWRMAMDAETIEEATKNQANFEEEAYQCIATMLRYIELGHKTIEKHKKEIIQKGEQK